MTQERGNFTAIAESDTWTLRGVSLSLGWCVLHGASGAGPLTALGGGYLHAVDPVALRP